MTDDPAAMPTPHVLIVEDEDRMRELLIRAVGQLELPATGVGSAEEALKVMVEHAEKVGIVLLDLKLPGMAGMELFAKLREKHPHLQVIVLTGFGDLDDAKQAIHLDAVEFLTKPAHLGDLEVALDRARRRLAKWHEKQVGSDIAQILADHRPASVEPGDAEEDAEPRSLKDLERRHILEALRRNGGNREKTAEELGISVRKLYYRLNEYQEQGYLEEE